MSKTLFPKVYQRISSIITHLSADLYERDEALRLGLLAALSGQSIFFLGPPGVAKSMVARHIASAFQEGRFFEYLMGKFSTPDEIFGPVSISRLKHEDRYSRNIEGYLPDAHIVFLDEIWKASPPIQNTLLAVLNERVFRNGDETLQLPLKCFMAASNNIAESEDTRAFWDRFLIRLPITPITSDQAFRQLLRTQRSKDREASASASLPNNADKSFAPISSQEWEQWKTDCNHVQLGDDIEAFLTELRRTLRADEANQPQYYISDRRWKAIAELLRASAHFHGRTQVNFVDCALTLHCVWNRSEDIAALDERINSAMAQTAFGSSARVELLNAELSGLSGELRDASSFMEEREELTPVKYDGEYLRLQAADDNSAQEDHGYEYRIWFDDLQQLNERGELELFVHKDGEFLHTELKTMGWKNRAKWELEGELGPMNIECQITKRTVRVEKPIDADSASHFSQQLKQLHSDIENALSNVKEELDKLKKEAASHLFVPRTQIEPLEAAATTRVTELQTLLAQSLELSADYGIAVQHA